MQELKKHGLISAETHPSLFAGDKLKCARSKAFWVCWRTAHCGASLPYVYYMHKHFVLKPFNGAKKEMAGREKMSHTFLFTIRRCLACSLYAISEIRESNKLLFP